MEPIKIYIVCALSAVPVIKIILSLCGISRPYQHHVPSVVGAKKGPLSGTVSGTPCGGPVTVALTLVPKFFFALLYYRVGCFTEVDITHAYLRSCRGPLSKLTSLGGVRAPKPMANAALRVCTSAYAYVLEQFMGPPARAHGPWMWECQGPGPCRAPMHALC